MIERWCVITKQTFISSSSCFDYVFRIQLKLPKGARAHVVCEMAQLGDFRRVKKGEENSSAKAEKGTKIVN